ncbi:MAG TPA: SusC/RagA family TonB-linked outer membrane protein [Gemmatimonadaceae bacterium]
MKFRGATRRLAIATFAVAASLAMARRGEAQQTGVVRGTVTDSATGRGVAGAQVRIIGTVQGASTNETGQYFLRGVPAGNAQVSAQRLGFAPLQRQVSVRAGDTTTVNFSLRAAAVQLGEVVSVGYGTSSRHEVTSAIASVDSSAIVNAPVAGVDNALQGRVAGVQVMQNSGEPGSGISVRVRGPASLNAGNQPLYVVDGIPIIQGSYDQIALSGQDMSAVTGLNPDEIASIDVLKDAAAAAIYGSRGSNGVVLITTKRGGFGNTRFSISSYVGTQHVQHTIGLLNAQQYVSLMNESAKNDGYDPSDYDFTPGVDDSASFDWQNAVFRTSPVSDINLSVSGGTDRLRYYTSGGVFDQRGIVIGSGYRRQSGRLNFDLTATRKLLITSSLGLTHEQDDRIPGDQSLDGVVTNAIGMQPMRPILGGSFGYGGDAEGLRYSNPVATAKYSFDTFKTMRALGNVEGKYTFNDRIYLNARAGADVYGVDELAWSSPKVDGTYSASVDGVGRTDHTTATKYLLETYLAGDAISNARQKLSLTGGTSVEWNHTNLEYLRGEGFPTGFTTYIHNAATITSWDGSANDNNLVGYFTRANWSYVDRYLASASLRVDGSSRFGSDNRYGTFPALSLAWIASDESFMKSISRLATVKFRASFGETGNQGIGDYASLSLATGTPYAGTAGIAGSQLGNNALKWETTKELDLGTDITTLGGRVGIIADWYDRNTSNLLVQRPIPTTSGYASIWDNIGAIRNAGVDLGIHTINLQSARGLGWTSDLNVTWNRNKVTDLYGGQPITFTVSSRITSIVAQGQPLGEFYMYKALRIDPADGDVVFATANGGETKSPTSSDLMMVGNPQPDYYGGFTNSFTYKSFDLRGFLQFSQGNKVFNMMRIFTDDGGLSYDNKSTLTLNRWQKPGDVTDEPRMSYDGTAGAQLMSSRMIEDGSFIRLGEITLGYRLPQSISRASHLNDGRLFVSGRNLKTWTKYTGYNPDVNSAGSLSNVVMGVDYYAYPLARTFSVGVTASW